MDFHSESISLLLIYTFVYIDSHPWSIACQIECYNVQLNRKYLINTISRRLNFSFGFSFDYNAIRRKKISYDDVRKSKSQTFSSTCLFSPNKNFHCWYILKYFLLCRFSHMFILYIVFFRSLPLVRHDALFFSTTNSKERIWLKHM